MESLKWFKKAAGVWSAQIGQVDPFTPLSIVDQEPRLETLEDMGESLFPFDEEDIIVERNSKRIIIRFPLTDDEKIYGFGLQFMKVNHRGRTRFLRVNSDPRQDTGETHAPIPFCVSSKGYGLLVNTSRIVRFYCGSCVRKDSNTPPVIKDRNTDPTWQATPLSDSMEIVVEDAGVELYIFSGKTMLDVVRRYNLYCGGGVLPPKWGLGFWHRVPLNYNDRQVIDEALEYRAKNIPCDVIGLEPGWHSSSYPVTYEWSKKRFPEPKLFIEQLDKLGFKVNLWEHPYVSPKSCIYPKLEPLSGSHTVWGGLVPDYSLKEAQDIYKEHHEKQHVNIGVSGYKLDECDGSELTGNSWIFPEHASFPSGHDGEQMRQMYGIIMQKMIYEIFRKHGVRTYGLVRASMAGSSSSPYVLYSDLYDHRQFVRALINSSFSGILWCPEVRDGNNAEDFVRRIQTVCFSPLAMLNAWASGFKPWSYPDVEGIIRKYINLRMQLLPYFYSAFARYYFEGIPPFRAIQLSANDDIDINVNAHLNEDAEIDDQYMAGDSLLIAPMFAGETTRKVYLPKGVWYDFDTGERYEGGTIIEIYVSLDKIPVFVKEGGIIPMMPALPHMPKAGEKVPLEIRYYGKTPGTFKLYDDDGETFAYEKGNYCWITLQVSIDEDGKCVGNVVNVEGDWEPGYSEYKWKYINQGMSE